MQPEPAYRTGPGAAKLVNAPHDQMFQRLAVGEGDLLAAAWLPGTHSHLFNPIQDRLDASLPFIATRWMVMPLWQRHFLNRTHQVRILADPKQVMGSADDAVLVASRAFVGRIPPRTAAILRRIDIGLDGVTEMDLAVNVSGRCVRQAAQDWLAANVQKVAAWMA
jgi:ABC-type proline/glycine betaine transport system substrate-binding protein